jgi:L-methionine (R)-S-oxide reductase
MYMDNEKKRSRYKRLYQQLSELLLKTNYLPSRMATVNAILHHKMDGFFWTGFYLLHEGKLLVGPYQGPVACQELAKDKGVCWTAINSQKAVVVPDVELFPGHIACDSRSLSEICIPVFSPDGNIVAVLDIDSNRKNNFDDVDAEELNAIVKLLFN